MPDAKRQRFPQWWQALLILLGGIVLGFGSCAAFLSNISVNGSGSNGSTLGMIFGAGFIGGGMLALVGFVLLIISAARGVVNSAAPPPAPFNALPATSVLPGAPVGAPGVPILQLPRECRILRRLQLALVVFMFLPAASIATSALVLMARPRAIPSVLLIVVTYLLSQGPYIFAFARIRRGLDRLGITVAFAASCALVVEGLLPLMKIGHINGYNVGFFAWPSLFFIGHIVVAVFAWQAGRLSPPEAGDAGLLVAAFAGVVVYLFLVRFLEAHFLPVLLGGRFR